MDELKAGELVLKHRSNLRKIWVALAIATACLSAMLLHQFWSPVDTDPVRLVAYFTAALVAVGALNGRVNWLLTTQPKSTPRNTVSRLGAGFVAAGVGLWWARKLLRQAGGEGR